MFNKYDSIGLAFLVAVVGNLLQLLELISQLLISDIARSNCEKQRLLSTQCSTERKSKVRRVAGILDLLLRSV